MRGRTDIANVRAAIWAARAIVQVRRELRRKGVRDAVVSVPPPRLPGRAERGVFGLLRRMPSTCLERALVLQRWHAAQGSRREVVIGVKKPDGAFHAHAWLDGAPDPELGSYEELMRIPARER